MSQCRLGEVLVFEILKERTRESFLLALLWACQKIRRKRSGCFAFIHDNI